MDQDKILEEARAFAEERLGSETTGHDYWHSIRVRDIAMLIQKEEGGDPFIIQLTALLHDVGDWKFVGGDEETGQRMIKEFLENHVDEITADRVLSIIMAKKYRGPKEESQAVNKETQIIQDADRLDAIGAIGIARAFASGYHFGQVLYDPDFPPDVEQSAEEFKKQYTGEKKNTTVNHFYEKLLLLKDKMLTDTGKRMAEGRHQFLEIYLKQFFKEWKNE